MIHGSLTNGTTAADFVAGKIGGLVSVAIGGLGVAMVVTGLIAGSGLLRDFPGKKPPA
jgi:hypothetical protein